MITVEEATRLINENLLSLTPETIRLERAVGRVLAQVVKADRDLPPFHRVTMDGIAIRFRSFQDGVNTYSIRGIQAAGQPALTLTDHHDCVEVMTGAMLPINADCVVPYEILEVKDHRAHVKSQDITLFQNIHRQGSDATANEILLSAGQVLSAAEIAILASVGIDQVAVMKMPRVAIVSTGDELVDITYQPLLHQIRRSNDRALAAALAEMNIPSVSFHFQDEQLTMEKQLREILDQFDVILLSGGVSKGKFDFVPEVLRSVGIENVFHQVSQRPGKPLWFGRSARHRVFALPGNPVSTFMCFHRYVKPWLLRCQQVKMDAKKAVLATDFTFKPDLTYFLQVSVKNKDGIWLADPIAGGGSGDFINLREVDGFLELPKGQNEFQAGKAFNYYPFRG